MATRLQHALEVSEGSATLYLSGVLTAADAFFLRGVCREIPERVRILRLDLHAVTRLEDGAMDTVRAVVRYWRASRHGNFRLSFATQHIVATVVEDGPSPTIVQSTETVLSRLSGGSPALTGMFL